jgi:hypothetical protein
MRTFGGSPTHRYDYRKGLNVNTRKFDITLFQRGAVVVALAGALSLPTALFDLSSATAAPTKQTAASEKKAATKKSTTKKAVAKKPATKRPAPARRTRTKSGVTKRAALTKKAAAVRTTTAKATKKKTAKKATKKTPKKGRGAITASNVADTANSTGQMAPEFVPASTSVDAATAMNGKDKISAPGSAEAKSTTAATGMAKKTVKKKVGVATRKRTKGKSAVKRIRARL